MEIKAFFPFDHYEFIKNEKIEKGSLLNSTNDSVDTYDYHVLKCGENMFAKFRLEEFHPSYKGDDEEMPHEDEDELVGGNVLKYCNATDEAVNILNQKCVKCFENPSVYAFRQNGHQCEICYATCLKAVDSAYTNWNIEMLKCAVGST